MSITSPISTCLIEQNTFFREGLKTLLADTHYNVETAYSDCIALREGQSDSGEVKLFILGVKSETDAMKAGIDLIKQISPESKVAILTSRVVQDCVVSAFSCGADGYLLRDITPQALTGSLDMIMAGEKVCPVGVLNLLLTSSDNTENERRTHRFVSDKLSERELQVLEYLPSGDTNKEIARNLDITEATVKVHIKAVLRKLDLSNRTQAAVWAVNKGVISQDNDVARAKAA